jgi:hypothetical protein
VPRSLSRSKVDGVTFVRLRDVSAASPALLAWNPDFETPAVTSFLACAQQVMEGR